MTDEAAHYSCPPYDVAALETSGGVRQTVRLEALPPELAEHFGACFSEMTPWAEYRYSRERLADFFANQQAGAPRMLICVDEVPAGVVAFRCEWLCGPYLQFLGIIPHFQGHGIGGAILSWWERQALAAGDRNLWITVSAFNVRARDFYGRHGFGEAAELPALIDETYCEILLRKRLK